MADTYTTAKIVALIRAKLDDSVTPYLVSDDEIAAALDEKQHEFAERTLCLTDSENFSISVLADDPWYVLDERIIKVREGYLTTAKTVVQAISSAALDSITLADDYGKSPSNWRTSTGTPWAMVTDIAQGSVRLVPQPVTTDTIELTAYVYPTKLTSISVELVIPDRWRQHLIAGALSVLFMAQDTETYDPKSAAQWGRVWESSVLKAVGTIERNTRGPGVVRMSRNSVW